MRRCLPSVRTNAVYVDEQSASDARSIDIALALSEDEQQDAADYVAYTQSISQEGEAPAIEEVTPLDTEPDPTTPEQSSADASIERSYFRPITEVTVDATLPEGLLPDQVNRARRRRNG